MFFNSPTSYARNWKNSKGAAAMDPKITMTSTQLKARISEEVAVKIKRYKALSRLLPYVQVDDMSLDDETFLRYVVDRIEADLTAMAEGGDRTTLERG
jgi:hypothetical protein